MADRPSRAVLVTGCSSGIGAATAGRLHRAGYPVYATARRVETLAGLAASGVSTLRLDVTDEESMRSAVARVVDEHGAVGVLVNNAGHGVAGAIEEVPLSAVRAQFEANVFGAVRLIQLVLPGMRAQRWGRIVNVSSILGRAAPPGGGVYESSKYALEGISDALRLEVAACGIRTALIEPGPVRTGFAVGMAAHLSGSGPYGAFHAQLTSWYRAVFGPDRPNLIGRFAVGAEDVARVVERAVGARRPRARYPVGLLSRGFLALRRTLPDTLFDAFIRSQFPVPHKGHPAPTAGEVEPVN